MQRDTIGIRGDIRLILKDINTGQEEVQDFHNLVVQVGRNEIAKALSGDSPAAITAIAVGIGSNTPTLGDLALQTELIRKSGENVTVTRTNNVLFVHAFFGANEANATLRELGLFAGADGSILISRASTNTVKDSTRTLTVEWTLTIGS